MTGEERCGSSLYLQPVFYRREFNGHITARTRSTLDAPAIGAADLDDCDRIFLDGLREIAARQKE